jgi:benzoylformate decarboxylase
LELLSFFGNPGSTEQPFLQEFPDDFTYVLALQEASAIAMADAFAQVTRRPALVSLHSSAGLGNALGNLVAAYHGNTPLIVTSGQQHRELVTGEPYLSNREATTMPKPWVKWSYEPVRAQDVPEAFMRAYAMALQPPAGPVYLSVPTDDWKQPLPGPARLRTVSDRVAPDAERPRLFADRIFASRRPALVFGPEVDRSGGWDAAIALAEKLARRSTGPAAGPCFLPGGPPLFCGPLGMSVKTISDRLARHDLAVVIGAEAFRYYPYVPGDYLPADTELLQITADPEVAAAARVGDSLLGDPKMAIDLLLDLVAEGFARTAPEPMARPRLRDGRGTGARVQSGPERRHRDGHRGVHAAPEGDAVSAAPVRRGRRTSRPAARRPAGRRTGRSRSRPRRPARPRTGTRSRCSPG